MATCPKEYEPARDYYNLLGISDDASASEIRTAYRKTSRLYHPDKVGDSEEAKQKLEDTKIARTVLEDEAERAKYNIKRNAWFDKQAAKAAYDTIRRQRIDALDSAETTASGGKRTASDRDADEKRARAIEKAREISMQRINATRERRQKEAESIPTPPPATELADDSSLETRSVKVYWIPEGAGRDVDDDTLTDIFPKGQISSVRLMKKQRKVPDQQVKRKSALLVFVSQNAAEKAVAKGSVGILESIEWAFAKDGRPA